MLIALDIDGCLANFAKRVEEILEKLHLPCDNSRYDFGILPETFARIHDQMILDCDFERLYQYPEVLHILNEWDKLGWEIWYTTSRKSRFGNKDLDNSIRLQTQIWLAEFPQGNQLIITENKLQTCRELGSKILVEDDIRVAERASEIKVYLLDRPWNGSSYVRFGEYDYPFRIRSLREVKDGTR